MRALLYRVSRRAVRLDGELEGALAASGVQLLERAASPGGLPAVVVFDEVTAAVQAVSALSLAERGAPRILALGVDARALPAGASLALRAAGADEVLAWTGTPELAERVAQRLARWAEVEAIFESPLVQDNLAGRNRSFARAVRRVIEVAAFTNASLLLVGESGTGKEVLARLLHTLDRRPDKRDLVVVDCTTLSPELAASDLFGHERGSYTGATGARDGAFAQADEGTLFLDEVGELPPGLQAQLLRVLQERTYRRVGGNTWHRTRFRLVTATHRDLSAGVAGGTVRLDFFHRLATWTVHVPSLAERSDDIVPMARHLLAQILGSAPPALDEEVCALLRARRYPGNVRELKQLLTRVSQLHLGPGPITLGDVAAEDLLDARAAPLALPEGAPGFDEPVRRALAAGASLRDIGRAASDAAVRIVTDEEGGNLKRAAARLGVTDRALQLRRRQGEVATPSDE